jgi:hypothetical protein
MARLFIPWRLFFVLLAKQPAEQRDQWLRWWLFRDRGVELVPPVLMPEGKVPPGIPLSARHKQEHAVLGALAEQKRARFLH